MGGKKKHIEVFGSFTEPFNWVSYRDDLYWSKRYQIKTWF